MARYQSVFPMVDSQANTFAQIQQYLSQKGFRYKNLDGEQVFQKGDGVWTAARFVKVSYYGNFARVEAWVDTMGAEQDLEGFVASAVKKPLKKIVAHIEEILTRPGVDYVPQEELEQEASENCVKCGATLVPGGKFCPICAHVVGAPAPEGMQIPAGISIKEYRKQYAGESFRRNVRNAAIVGYICAGINAVISLIAVPLGLIDSVIFLALTLGMHLGKSKGCAIGMLVYAIFTVVVGLVATGTLGGWLWIVAGVNALIVFKNADKKYHELIQN